MRRLSREKKLLFAILAFGLILRLSFILFGAEIYFSRENIFTDKDTGVWKTCITNLIETGAYTLDHEHEYGPFARMPGYGFFMGFFWLLCGQNWNLAFHVIGWTQLFLDIICIYLVYCIARSVFQRGRPAYIAAFLYACYPFIIVWNPVVYSESLSVFFGMLCLYFLLTKKRSVFLLASGVCLGLAALNRPQFILMAPVALLYLSMKSIRELKLMIIRCLIFSLGFLVMYGSWPLRNYINYGKVIITQDLRAIRNWDVDVIAFMNYIYSVKAEWEPQFSNIIHNKKVEFPELAYISPQDSLMLEKAVALSKTCGKGFSYWIGYWKEPIENEGCTKEIETLFTALRDNQIKT
ncbi:MAG: glycosyltransferase family 39 protein, partial [Bacteroidetes bacterium]|nr:glycosyltransferase family 39 protein [Bacteroidota bacterium]